MRAESSICSSATRWDCAWWAASAHDGFGREINTGGRLGKFTSHSFRAALRWRPTDDLDVTLRGDYSNSTVRSAAFPGSRSAGVRLESAGGVGSELEEGSRRWASARWA